MYPYYPYYPTTIYPVYPFVTHAWRAPAHFYYSPFVQSWVYIP